MSLDKTNTIKRKHQIYAPPKGSEDVSFVADNFEQSDEESLQVLSCLRVRWQAHSSLATKA